MRQFCGLLLAAVLISIAANAQTPAWQPAPGHVTLPLWPHGLPQGSKPAAGPEINTTSAQERMVAGKPVIRLGNVSSPSLTVYQPKGVSSGAAVVVFPGGAYRVLAIDLEGTEVCDWLNNMGVACVLVKYRVPDSGPYPKPAALQDAQRALGILRQHAAEWHIDPERIGVLGFSAGAHLSAALSTNFERRIYEPQDAADQFSCRPSFQVVIYPGYLALAEQDFAANPEIKVTAQTPPALIIQTEDDPVHVENSTLYFLLLKKAGVPAEMHLFSKGGHGYGLRRTADPVTNWPELANTWLHTIHVLPSMAGDAQGSGN